MASPKNRFDFDKLTKQALELSRDSSVDLKIQRLLSQLAYGSLELIYYSDEMEAEVRDCRDKNDGNLWYWQGDGYDHPESLTCPILIRPHKLMSLMENSTALQDVNDVV